MLNFQQFLNENLIPAGIDPMVADFLSEVEKLPKVELSGAVDPSNFPFSTCWWCSSNESLFNSYNSASAAGISDVVAAEEEERTERKKNLREKKITPFYLIELKIQVYNAHIYRVVGINMENKSMFFQGEKGLDIGDVEHNVDETFDKVLKKHYPTWRAGKKLGL